MIIKLSGEASKNLDKIPTQKRKKIISKIPILANNPFIGKKLKGEFKGLFSLKVWPYRILYQISRQKVITVVAVEHRQGAYK